MIEDDKGKTAESAIPPGTREPSEDGSFAHQKEANPIKINGWEFIYSVAFLVDGKHVVSGGRPGKIRRWQVEDGKGVGAPMYTGSPVFSIAVSPDGRWIFSGTDSGLVTVWNAKNHSKVTELTAHNDAVFAVDVSPDGTRIATGSNDKTLYVWSLPSGQRLLGPFKHDDFVVAVKFSPNGRLIATATWQRDSVRVYDLDSQNGSFCLVFSVTVGSQFNQSLAWANDSKQLFVLSRDGNVSCLDVSTGKTRSTWSIHTGSDEAKCIALGGNGTFITVSANSSVSFWDTTTHERIGSVIEHTHDIWVMAISANYDLVSGGQKTVTLLGLYDILPSRYFGNVRVSEKAHVTSLLITIRSVDSHESLANGKSSSQKLKELISGRPVNPFKYRTMVQVRSFVPQSRFF
jgi:WD40 repeat protein